MLGKAVLILLIFSGVSQGGDVISACDNVGYLADETIIREVAGTTRNVPLRDPVPLEARITDRYENLNLIGEGTESQVFQAIDAKTKKPVVIKVDKRSDDRFGNRLEAEAKILEKVNAVVPAGTVSPFPKAEYMDLFNQHLSVQEFFPRNANSTEPAPSLKDRQVSGFQGMDCGKNCEAMILDKVARAMQTAHSAGVVHRDLKPENILVDDKGNIKIIDWSLASNVGDAQPKGIPEGSISGTPTYMGDAQKFGAPAHPKHDVDALRLIAWDLLAKSKPVKNNVGRPADHVFERPYGPHGQIIPEPKYAPEFSGVDDRLAVAAWSRTPTTMQEYRELLDRAQAPRPDGDFYKWYGKKLEKLPTDELAIEILSSKNLLMRFPKNIGLDEAKTDQVIMTILRMYRSSMRLGALPTGPHRYYHYNDFFDQYAQLAKNGIIKPTRYYSDQTREISPWEKELDEEIRRLQRPRPYVPPQTSPG